MAAVGHGSPRKSTKSAQRTGPAHGVRDDEHPLAHGAAAKSRAAGFRRRSAMQLIVGTR